MDSGLGWTTLAIWRVGWDEPRLPYGERAETDRARHMESGLRQTALAMGWTALAIWRAGWGGLHSPYGERAGADRTRHMVSGLGRTALTLR